MDHDQGFTYGLLGIPTGGAQNATGLMLNQAMKEEAGQTPMPEEIPRCKFGEVRWSASGECFTPGQEHINALISSLAANGLLLVALIVTIAGNIVNRRRCG